MRDFKKNPRAHVVSKFIVACTGTLLLFVLAVLATRAAWGMYTKFTAASAAAQASALELAQAESQKDKVAVAIESLSAERGIEENLRERFGVVKPGEGEIRIVRKEREDGFEPYTEEKNILLRILDALLPW